MAVLPLIALGVGLAGTTLSSVGQIQAGRAQKAGYDYNAKVNEADAVAARASAAREEEVHREKLKRLMGTQKAVFGAAGVEMEGSPLLILMNTAAEGEREAEFIKYGGEVEATKSLNEARLNRLYGRTVAKSGIIGGASTFLTGLGQAGLTFAQMRK